METTDPLALVFLGHVLIAKPYLKSSNSMMYDVLVLHLHLTHRHTYAGILVLNLEDPENDNGKSP